MNGDVGAEFGRTWWGAAWVEALEQRARLDPNRLPRGRDYARSGAVGDLTLAPGEARAQVQGRKTRSYEVRIRVRRFTDEEWDRVLTAISARLAHAAALLDGELPPQIAEDAASAGLDLLPGGGEIGPRCSCPDDADPCKHSAAACYLVADALDADPFVLLLLRGRTRDQVLAGVRARRRGVPGSAGSGAAARVSARSGRAADDGVDARRAFEAPAPGAEIPAPPLPPARPGQPVALPVDPPARRARPARGHGSCPQGGARPGHARVLADGRAQGPVRANWPGRRLPGGTAAWRALSCCRANGTRSRKSPSRPTCSRRRAACCARRRARRKALTGTGSPPGACSCGSGVTCAGIRTRVRTATGSQAGRPRPIRPRPWRVCRTIAERGCVGVTGQDCCSPLTVRRIRSTIRSASSSLIS